MVPNSSRRWLLAGLTAVAAAAQAAPVAPQPHTPAQRVAAWKAQAAKAAATPKDGTADIAAPVLERFAVIGDVKAQAVSPRAKIDLSLTDDLSGIQMYSITLIGPSGQYVQRVEGLQTGQRAVNGRVSVGADLLAAVPFTRYSEPGTWVVDNIFVSDSNWNMRMFDRDALAALGRNTFEVVNPNGHDAKPPALVSGRLNAQSFSLSTPPAGAAPGTLPYVAATLQTTDEGNGAVSGVFKTILSYCLLNEWNDCIDSFELQGHVDKMGQAKATLRAGGQPRADQTPGRYRLQYVYLQDAAFNFVQMFNSELGTVFPRSNVTIEP